MVFPKRGEALPAFGQSIVTQAAAKMLLVKVRSQLLASFFHQAFLKEKEEALKPKALGMDVGLPVSAAPQRHQCGTTPGELGAG